MGYSRSKKTIDRVRPVLDLLEVNDTGLIFPSKNPQKLSYAIRDALAVVKALPPSSEDFKKYGGIPQKFRIRIQHEGVLFEKREELHYDSPIDALAAQRSSSITLPNVESMIGVVGAMIKEKAAEFIFPSVLPSFDEFDRLSLWCNKNNYIIVKSLPLTIVKSDGDSSQENNISVEG